MFLENGGYCNADILPCFTYKKFVFFESYSDSRKDEGIEFFADSGESIVNFPHQHFKSLAAKSNSTSGSFKETVRMFKNIKDELLAHRKIAEGFAKSYFIENLLFNVTDETFAGSYRDRYINVLDKIITDFNNGATNNYICANGVHKLISDKTWNSEALKQFLIGLIYIRDNNEF